MWRNNLVNQKDLSSLLEVAMSWFQATFTLCNILLQRNVAKIRSNLEQNFKLEFETETMCLRNIRTDI